MIKVDVGKAEGKARGVGAIRNPTKISIPAKYTGGRKVDIDLVAVLIVLASLIVAMLPQPFLRRYKANKRAEHRAKVTELNGQISNVEREITSLRPYQAELQSYEQQKKLASDQLGVVQRLLAARATPVNVLDIIGQSLPPRAWINTIQLRVADNPTLSMSGQAYASEEISDYLDELSESVYLSEVTLEDVTSGSIEKVIVRKFQITAKPTVK